MNCCPKNCIHCMRCSQASGNFVVRLVEPFWFQNVQLIIFPKVPLNLFPIKCMTSLYLKEKRTQMERICNYAVWSSSIEGCSFLFCCQIRNGKQTAILAVAVEVTKGKKDSEKNKKDQFYTIYRPNTGLQVWKCTVFIRVCKESLNLHGWLSILMCGVGVNWHGWCYYLLPFFIHVDVISA
jgi:hypothetical protein